jgi:hypothetical protein
LSGSKFGEQITSSIGSAASPPHVREVAGLNLVHRERLRVADEAGE